MTYADAHNWATSWVYDGYATKWRLTVNIGKTKGIVFRRLKSKVYPLPLVYAGAQLEVVESFRYLGLDLDCSKSIDTASGIRAEAAGRSEWTLSSRCRELGIQGPALKLHLWDAIVKPSMLYSTEV